MFATARIYGWLPLFIVQHSSFIVSQFCLQTCLSRILYSVSRLPKCFRPSTCSRAWFFGLYPFGVSAQTHQEPAPQDSVR